MAESLFGKILAASVPHLSLQGTLAVNLLSPEVKYFDVNLVL
jgi:hypothetical protein